MKKLIFAFALIMAMFVLTNCKNPKAAQQQEALKAEIVKLDSVANDLEETAAGIKQTAKELEEALKELDIE